MSNASTYKRILPWTLLAVLLLAACETGPTEPSGLQLAIYYGDNQVAPAGSTLYMGLAVRVTDSRGKPVPDVRIRWAVEEGGGWVSTTASPSVTDVSGTARVNRTLGSNAGIHTTTASIDGTPDAAVRFTSIAQIQGATQMTLNPGTHGDGQTDTVLATLAPYRVLVRDHNDAPVAGVEVRWSGGSVSSASSTTDASGIAQVTHTLGTSAGMQRVVASVPRLIGSPVTFEATANPGNPTATAIVSGEDQVRRVSTAIGPYAVQVTDSYGNSIGGVTIDWAVTSGGGTIDPPQSVTADANTRPGERFGIAAATHTLGPDEGAQSVTATASGIPGALRVMFTTRAVSALVSLNVPSLLDSYCWYYGQDCDPSFEPSEVIVPVGGTVAWIWNLTGDCNVVFEDDVTEPTSAGMQKTGRHFRTFTTPGTYRYRCTPHSTSFTEGMVGTVTVQ